MQAVNRAHIPPNHALEISVTRPIKTRLASVLALSLLGALGACGGGDDRIEVRSITVFGDSMNDVGTYAAATGSPTNPGKFTVNPGNIWVENVAAAFGLALKPNRSLTLDKDASGGATTQVGTATVLGGNGYAEGGARVAQYPSESGVGNNQLVAPVKVQLEHYLSTHPTFAPGELVLIDGGGNDTFAQFSAICWGTDDNGVGPGNTTIASATQVLRNAAREQVATIRRIKDKGAAVVFVSGAGDWSKNPFATHYLSSSYQQTGCYAPVTPAQVTDWTRQFNQIIVDGIANLPGVVYLDPASVFDPVMSKPADYGIVNVTVPACTNTQPTSSAAFCTMDTLIAPNADQTYFWSDAFHPTPRGHQLLSNRALELLKPIARKQG